MTRRSAGSPVFGVSKTCPSCKKTYPTDPETGHEYWYLRKVKRKKQLGPHHVTGLPTWTMVELRIPSAYCKSCEKKRVVEARRLRRSVDKLPEKLAAEMRAQRGGKCDVCARTKRPHYRRLITHLGIDYAICTQCRLWLAVVHWDYEQAHALWRKWFDHLILEQNLKKLHHSDRGRQWHERRSGEPPLPDWVPDVHLACVAKEKQGRFIMHWLHNHF